MKPRSLTLPALAALTALLGLAHLPAQAIGRLADVTSLFKEAQINLQSFFCWPDSRYADISHLVMRVAPADGERAIAALEGHGFRVLTRYEKDLRPFLPAARSV